MKNRKHKNPSVKSRKDVGKIDSHENLSNLNTIGKNWKCDPDHVTL